MKIKVSNIFSGDLIDWLNKNRFFLSFILGIICGILYYLKILKNPRNGVGDMITVSSIILATAGIFIGLLVGEAKNSEFFKLADKVEKGGMFFNYLLNKIRNIFIENIFFILLTLSFDFIGSFIWIWHGISISTFIKSIVVCIWIMLLLLSLWDLFYVVDCITNIMMATKKENDVDTTD